MVSIYSIFLIIIFIVFFNKFLSSLSPITLILGSVPDFLTKILPRPLINLFAIFIALWTVFFFKIFLFVYLIFSKICGVFSKTSKNLLALIFLSKARITSKATKRPSPVVANFPRIIWPDCSPPKLNFFFLHYLFYIPISNLSSNKANIFVFKIFF